MDERSDQILEHIEAQRTELGQNLNELQTRVRRSTDWRTYFENNPALMLGVAIGGGILLGAMVGGGSRRSMSGPYPTSRRRSGTSPYVAAAAATGAASMPDTHSERSHSVSSPAVEVQKSRASETIENIKAAMIAFGITKAKELLGQALPGFDQHYDEAAQRNARMRGFTSERREYSEGSRERTESASGYDTGYGDDRFEQQADHPAYGSGMPEYGGTRDFRTPSGPGMGGSSGYNPA